MQNFDFDKLSKESVVITDEDLSSLSSDILARAIKQFTGIHGVEGVGLGNNSSIVVFVSTEGVRQKLPDQFEGLPVVCRFSGSVTAQARNR